MVKADHRYAADRPVPLGVDRLTAAEIAVVAPVSPAVPPVATVNAAGPSRAIPLLPGERTMARRMKFVLVNTCTLASLTLGLLAIFLAMQGDVHFAALCLIACVSFDGLDGALARKLGVASPFGAQMDSLADMCSFGIATPVVVFQWLSGDLPDWAIGGACGLIAVCAAIRLARFNVSPKDGRYFSGVPTTLAATVLALSILLLSVTHVAMAVGIAALALTMVLGFPYAKLGQLRKVPVWLWILPVVGLYLNLEVTFLALVCAYLLSGPVLWAVHRRRSVLV